MSKYVYRLKVNYPEGIGPDNPPEGWDPGPWNPDPEAIERGFCWPRPRRCLSLDTAQKWAKRLEGWGCKVEIERSLPVLWSEDADEQACLVGVLTAERDLAIAHMDPDHYCAGTCGFKECDSYTLRMEMEADRTADIRASLVGSEL